ncbi:MAG: hypothetical protein V3U11_01330, partial [Planctomycetota bacterium]
MRSLVLMALVATSCSHPRVGSDVDALPTPTASRFLSRSGCDLDYEVTGSGPPLVLVHGAADHRIFDPVVS